MEIWKKIEGYNYEVSDWGNVRHSTSKQIIDQIYDKPGEKRKYDKYPVVLLFGPDFDGHHIKRIYRLVAEYFVPNLRKDNPDVKVVDHIDRNKLNSNANNLRWVSMAENNRNRSLNNKNKSGYMGVRQTYCGTWMATLACRSKTFKKKGEAIRQRKQWELKCGFESETFDQFMKRQIDEMKYKHQQYAERLAEDLEKYNVMEKNIPRWILEK